MMCTPRHLRVSGNKQELVQRLVQAGWTTDCGVKPVPKRRRTAGALRLAPPRARRRLPPAVVYQGEAAPFDIARRGKGELTRYTY